MTAMNVQVDFDQMWLFRDFLDVHGVRKVHNGSFEKGNVICNYPDRELYKSLMRTISQNWEMYCDESKNASMFDSNVIVSGGEVYDVDDLDFYCKFGQLSHFKRFLEAHGTTVLANGTVVKGRQVIHDDLPVLRLYRDLLREMDAVWRALEPRQRQIDQLRDEIENAAYYERVARLDFFKQFLREHGTMVFTDGSIGGHLSLNDKEVSRLYDSLEQGIRSMWK